MKAKTIWIMSGLILIFALGACGPKRQRINDPLPELTPAMRDQIQQRLTFYDTNGDGIVSCDDVASRRVDLFKLVDKDENGGLDSGEYLDLRWHDKLYVLLELPNDDLNQDGMVSLEELQQRGDPFFGRIDIDRDCIITVEEYRVELRATSQERLRPENTGGTRQRRRAHFS